MATASGTYAPNRNQIITRALRQCNAIDSGETPSSQEISDADDALNALVAGWQATGIHVWAETEGIIFTQPGQIRYALGGTNADYACTDVSWVQTSLSVGNIAGATNLAMTSVKGLTSGNIAGPGINVGDYIGIMLSTNVLYWTTVSAVTSSPAAITIAGPGLPTSAAVNAIVVSFPVINKMGRPLRVLDARRFYLPSLIETQLTRSARLDYRDLPDKTTGGTITMYFFDPQETTAYAWAWPAPQDSLSAIKFTFMRALGDFTSPSDTPDFPQEWTNPLTWCLADELVPEYGVGQVRAGYISKKAEYWLDVVQGWDREPESSFFGVDFDQSGRG